MGVAMNVGIAISGVVVWMGKVTIVVKMAVSLGMCNFDRVGEGLLGYIMDIRVAMSRGITMSAVRWQ